MSPYNSTRRQHFTDRAAVIITSSIFPSAATLYGTTPDLLDPTQRLEQTKATIRSLVVLGYSTIYLADNSGKRWKHGTEEELSPAVVLHFDQHQFANKGITELYLLQAALPHLPVGVPIVKVSGRYQLHRRLDTELDDVDFVFKLHKRFRNYSYVSTIAYAVRCSEVFGIFVQF